MRKHPKADSKIISDLAITKAELDIMTERFEKQTDKIEETNKILERATKQQQEQNEYIKRLEKKMQQIESEKLKQSLN